MRMAMHTIMRMITAITIILTITGIRTVTRVRLITIMTIITTAMGIMSTIIKPTSIIMITRGTFTTSTVAIPMVRSQANWPVPAAGRGA
jgi:hypothetical protein